MLKPGDLLGPYEIRGFVGQGGMGQVYRAFDPRLERTVALKIIQVPENARVSGGSGGGGDSGSGRGLVGEGSTRMLREARAVASLSHPNVVAIYDVGESDGRLYLAMEYVVGSALRHFVGSQEIPLARRVRWLIEVARALEAAHKNGIIHRDVKPENVMVREDGGVKVLDFGIARRTVNRTNDEVASADTVTGSGGVAGTPVYMAPEQIKGADVDARCDQFAWGIMAYELVTGERPWSDGDDVLTLVANILTEAPPSIKSKTKDVPAVVEETIMRALSKTAGGRFPSMADAADALEPFATVSTGGGDRVRVTPATPINTDDAAYAATTRVPTTTDVGPDPNAETSVGTKPTPKRSVRLAVPILLLTALAVVVVFVKSREPTSRVLANPSVQRPLSTVPAAEAAYKEAMSLWHDGAGVKARAGLQRAIELDPTFAAAHLELALQTPTGETAAAQASFQSAYEHRHMLVPRDERLLEASQPFIRPKPDVEEWETRMTAAVFEYPRDPELQYWLGRSRQQQGEHHQAKAAFQAALKLDEGFIPALAAMARSDKSLGNVSEGLAATERCVKRAPFAATCVQTRYELFNVAGQCHEANEVAKDWGNLEPQSPVPFAALARTLHADNAPRASIEEVFARKWSLVAPDKRKSDELWDRTLFAVLDGNFERADDLAREFDASLPVNADSDDHSSPARLRMNMLLELDRAKDAARVARTFLDRMAAWQMYPFRPDPSLDFYEALYRSGEMNKKELDQKRADWKDRERRRIAEGRGANDPWFLWAAVYGGFSETREEAQEAIAQMPHTPTPQALRTGLLIDFALGKTYALTGRWEEAIPPLKRVVSTCDTFEAVMIVEKSRVLLGQALEAKGDVKSARTTYERVTESWPKTLTSHTRKRAAERLAALPRD